MNEKIPETIATGRLVQLIKTILLMYYFGCRFNSVRFETIMP